MIGMSYGVFHPVTALLLQATHDPDPLWRPRTRKEWIKFYAANKNGHVMYEDRIKAISMGTVKEANDPINWDRATMERETA
jgi:hypothetical protein